MDANFLFSFLILVYSDNMTISNLKIFHIKSFDIFKYLVLKLNAQILFDYHVSVLKYKNFKQINVKFQTCHILHVNNHQLYK